MSVLGSFGFSIVARLGCFEVIDAVAPAPSIGLTFGEA
jgi:hypothetical protein